MGRVLKSAQPADAAAMLGDHENRLRQAEARLAAAPGGGGGVDPPNYSTRRYTGIITPGDSEWSKPGWMTGSQRVTVDARTMLAKDGDGVSAADVFLTYYGVVFNSQIAGKSTTSQTEIDLGVVTIPASVQGFPTPPIAPSQEAIGAIAPHTYYDSIVGSLRVAGDAGGDRALHLTVNFTPNAAMSSGGQGFFFRSSAFYRTVESVENAP